MDGNQLDIKVKTAKFIDKNNSIIQEFYFAHPETKVKINYIYNGHWTGSQLWRLGCQEQMKLESTYNKSVKMVFDLPWATHRYLIEPLTGLPHVKKVLVNRFLSFVRMIRKSSKIAISQLLETILSDVRFTTGCNMRNIMLMAEKNTIGELEMGGVDIKYHDTDSDTVAECQHYDMT